jgi:multiple sugar transport system ATP-binding protein
VLGGGGIVTDVVLDGVTKVYPGGFRAVRDLRLHIRDGELFVLLGPSGCGKSTILRMIAGLETITAGDLWLGGEYANEMEPSERNVSMVFQNGALYPHRSVRGNLAFPLEIARGDPAQTKEKVVELARALGIDSMLDRLPSTLSGGQRQRVAMGRAVIREPSIFLMDEPLSNLDAALRSELRMEIGGLVRSLGVTTLYVTHDQVEALTLADRMAIMRDGLVQDVGTPMQLYNDPATMFVAAFLSQPPINLLQATAYASQEEGITFDFGAQRLTVPWTDPRSPSFMAGHGQSVVVGIRADALTPLHEQQQPGPQPTLAVRLRELEFHGHEWLAHAEAGIPAIDPGVLDAPAHAAASERPSTAERVWDLLRGTRRTPAPQNGSGHHEDGAGHGHHRRSDLLFRVSSGRGLRPGQELRLAVDMERIFVFGANGRRLDPAQR